MRRADHHRLEGSQLRDIPLHQSRYYWTVKQLIMMSAHEVKKNDQSHQVTATSRDADPPRSRPGPVYITSVWTCSLPLVPPPPLSLKHVLFVHERPIVVVQILVIETNCWWNGSSIESESDVLLCSRSCCTHSPQITITVSAIGHAMCCCCHRWLPLRPRFNRSCLSSV